MNLVKGVRSAYVNRLLRKSQRAEHRDKKLRKKSLVFKTAVLHGEGQRLVSLGIPGTLVSPCCAPPHKQFFILKNPSGIFTNLDTLMSTKCIRLLAPPPVRGLYRQTVSGAQLAVTVGRTAQPRGGEQRAPQMGHGGVARRAGPHTAGSSDAAGWIAA